MRINISREKNIRYLWTFLLVTFPVFRVYASGFTASFNLAELMITLLMFFCFILYGQKILFCLTKFEATLFIVLLIVLIINAADRVLVSQYTVNGVLLRLCKWMFYYVIFLFQLKLFDLGIGIKIFKYTGLFVCILMWIQIICYKFFGAILTMKIPFLKINAWQQEYLQFDYKGVNIFRPYSVFQEPSHVVYYISLILCLVLFVEKNKYKYVWAFLFTISLAASTSTTAFVFLGIIWGWFILGLVKSKKVKNYYLIIFLGICLLFGFIVLMRTSFAEYVLDKLLNGTSRTNSFLKYFLMLPCEYRILGIGMGNEAYYFEHALQSELGFVNGFGYLLLSIGVIGCIIYVLQLMYYFFKSRFNVKIFIVLYVLLLSIDVVFRDIYFVLYMSIPLIMYYKKADGV